MKPYYEDDAVTIYHGDAREILPELDAVDVILSDPPYSSGGFQESGVEISERYCEAAAERCAQDVLTLAA